GQAMRNDRGIKLSGCRGPRCWDARSSAAPLDAEDAQLAIARPSAGPTCVEREPPARACLFADSSPPRAGARRNVRPAWYVACLRAVEVLGTTDEAVCDQIPELGREAEGFRAEAEGSAGRSAARSEEAAAEDAGARDDASARGPTQLAWQSQLSRHRRCVPRREGALRAAGDPLHRARE